VRTVFPHLFCVWEHVPTRISWFRLWRNESEYTLLNTYFIISLKFYLKWPVFGRIPKVPFFSTAPLLKPYHRHHHDGPSCRARRRSTILQKWFFYVFPWSTLCYMYLNYAWTRPGNALLVAMTSLCSSQYKTCFGRRLSSILHTMTIVDVDAWWWFMKP